MVHLYNIYANLHGLVNNAANFAEVINQWHMDLLPILTETWRGAYMGILAHFDNPI